MRSDLGNTSPLPLFIEDVADPHFVKTEPAA